MWKPEAATRSVLSKNYSCKFCKFHKKGVAQSNCSKKSLKFLGKPHWVMFTKVAVRSLTSYRKCFIMSMILGN